LSESQVERNIRLEKAGNAIIEYPDSNSFYELINSNRELFNGFRLIYSTNNTISNFNSLSLKDIEIKYPVITKYFGGSGLLFYEDSLYSEILEKGETTSLIWLSISIDTQVADAFRCFSEGKNIQDSERFHSIIHLIKEKGFNFDYHFYLTEDICHTFDFENLRPFNTIKALKLFDSLDMVSYKKNRNKPEFTENIVSAGRRANETIISFQAITVQALIKRKGLFLILLKATQLFWGNKKHSSSLAELLEYSVKTLGQFAKLEIYFGWKLLKYAKEFNFFGPIRQPSEKALKKLNGMSWDLYMLRHQEKMANTSSNEHDFYIPLIATFDRRFQNLIEAFPIRCLLMDDKHGRTNTIFFDEIEFFEDLNDFMPNELNQILSNSQSKVDRFNNPLPEKELDKEIEKLQAECKSYIKC